VMLPVNYHSLFSFIIRFFAESTLYAFGTGIVVNLSGELEKYS
jgi:hypothetical protein